MHCYSMIENEAISKNNKIRCVFKIHYLIVCVYKLFLCSQLLHLYPDA